MRPNKQHIGPTKQRESTFLSPLTLPSSASASPPVHQYKARAATHTLHCTRQQHTRYIAQGTCSIIIPIARTQWYLICSVAALSLCCRSLDRTTTAPHTHGAPADCAAYSRVCPSREGRPLPPARSRCPTRYAPAASLSVVCNWGPPVPWVYQSRCLRSTPTCRREEPTSAAHTWHST